MGACILAKEEGREKAMKIIKKKTSKNKPILLREFAGLKDLTTFIESTAPDEGWSDNHASDDFAFNPRWCGARSYTEAKVSLQKGANVQEIKKAVTRGAGVTEKKKRTMDIIGGAPNVPAYLAGSPACMYRIDRVKSRGAYNVFVDVGVHCGVKKSEVCDAGIEILLRVLRLASNYPVNLYVGDLSKYDEKIYGHAVKIMDAGRPYNTARVSYALTEVGFLRVFGLAVIERNNGFWSASAQYGYGRPLHSDERKDAVNVVFKNAILVSTLEVVNHDVDAFKAIDAVLNEGRKHRK